MLRCRILTPWLEDPTFASRLDWLSTVAGLDRDYDEAGRRDDQGHAVAQPLLVATGLVAVLETARPCRADGVVVAGHSVGETRRRRRCPGTLTPEAAMVLVGLRGRAMAAASATARRA